MFKTNNKNTRSTSMTYSGVFIVNFQHISLFSSGSVVDFEQVNVVWEETSLNSLLTFFATFFPFGVFLSLFSFLFYFIWP